MNFFLSVALSLTNHLKIKTAMRKTFLIAVCFVKV